MKKTFRFLSMAALLVVGAIMTGCSNDDNIDNPQQPANNDNVVTLTATVSFDGAAGTRAIDGTTGTKTFESGKQIAVFYEDADGNLRKAESTDFTPTGDNTKATFTVTLSTPKSGGKIRYIYPASMAKALDATPPTYPAAATIDAVTIDYSGIFGSQDGTLTTLANYDLAVKDATLSGTDQPVSVTLANPLAICKFTLQDEGSNVITGITRLTISDGTIAYTVKPTSTLSEVYVAMKPVGSGNFCFTANTATKYYTKIALGKALAAGNLYPITVPMKEFSLATPLTLEAITDGTIFVVNPPSGMQYSLNGGAKTAVPDCSDIVVDAGAKVAFYGNGTSITNYLVTTIAGGTAQVKIYGNIMSLVNETGFSSATTLPENDCFYELFYYYSNLKDASGLLLPATTLAKRCYDAMFSACYSLTAAPELPATTLTESCYDTMFNGCTSLTTAPELKATSLAICCYYYMFSGCTSLTTAPELKATSLADYCYYKMFNGCTSLTSAYVKADYTITNGECSDMFTDCSAAGAVLHTTTASKDSWDGVMGSGKTWSNWTAVGDWN